MVMNYDQNKFEVQVTGAELCSYVQNFKKEFIKNVNFFFKSQKQTKRVQKRTL